MCLLFQLPVLCNLPIFPFRARLLIVMEMMEGGELFHRISQHRHFTEKMASQVTKQVCAFVCLYVCMYVHVCVHYISVLLCHVSVFRSARRWNTVTS